MWEYTDKVKELYTNPKNVGNIENADATSEVGSIVCGDALKLYMKIDENNIILMQSLKLLDAGAPLLHLQH